MLKLTHAYKMEGRRCSTCKCVRTEFKSEKKCVRCYERQKAEKNRCSLCGRTYHRPNPTEIQKLNNMCKTCDYDWMFYYNLMTLHEMGFQVPMVMFCVNYRKSFDEETLKKCYELMWTYLATPKPVALQA